MEVASPGFFAWRTAGFEREGTGREEKEGMREGGEREQDTRGRGERKKEKEEGEREDREGDKVGETVEILEAEAWRLASPMLSLSPHSIGRSESQASPDFRGGEVNLLETGVAKLHGKRMCTQRWEGLL